MVFSYHSDMFYIEMKLGVPPWKYYFHIDTGSGLTWVNSNIRGLVQDLATWVSASLPPEISNRGNAGTMGIVTKTRLEEEFNYRRCESAVFNVIHFCSVNKSCCCLWRWFLKGSYLNFELGIFGLQHLNTS